MIITCDKCHKKFDINSNLIPKNGRLLECGSCNHQWFFKIDSGTISPDLSNLTNHGISKESPETKNENYNLIINKIKPKELKKINKRKRDDFVDSKKVFVEQKSLKIFSFLIVFIISFIALILVVDTFKYPLSTFFPNLELVLYNLYETFKDIKLFLYDLV
jgi:predicted Zn finger-like uncharacterized protein